MKQEDGRKSRYEGARERKVEIYHKRMGNWNMGEHARIPLFKGKVVCGDIRLIECN